jgi:hypothetical protein
MKLVCIAVSLPTLLLVSGTARAEQQDIRVPITTITTSTGLQQSALQQQPSNLPPQAQAAEQSVEAAVRRFRIGIDGGVGVDPELVMFGAHATFGPVFHPDVEFRPGLEVGLGELTTLISINMDVLYAFPGGTGANRWRSYIGVGPTFGLSHRGLEADDIDDDLEDLDDLEDETPGLRNRFDFSDTDFNGGVNFIAGAENQRGLFFELKATAGGVSNIRLMAGFTF